jgi:hypothetical protein
MADDGSCIQARWLWNSVLGLTTLALAGLLAVIVALTLGWNSPRPARPPDWRAASLPLSLEVPPGGTAVTLLERSSSDFTLEADAAPLSEPRSGFISYGLAYRVQDAAHYYVFAVGSDGYYAVLRLAGDEETPLVGWQQFPHVHRGRQANRLRITCAGPMCHFYVNDEYVTNVEDTTWLKGDVGLWMRSFGNDIPVVRFARLWAWE